MSMQILIICLWIIELMAASYMHGKPKTGNYSVFTSAFSIWILYTILYYGGFFDVMFIHTK